MPGDTVMPPVTSEEHMRAKLWSQRMYETDLVSDLATAEDRGEKKRALAIAKNLLSIGPPLDQIIHATVLSRDEVEELGTDG